MQQQQCTLALYLRVEALASALLPVLFTSSLLLHRILPVTRAPLALRRLFPLQHLLTVSSLAVISCYSTVFTVTSCCNTSFLSLPVTTSLYCHFLLQHLLTVTSCCNTSLLSLPVTTSLYCHFLLQHLLTCFLLQHLFTVTSCYNIS